MARVISKTQVSDPGPSWPSCFVGGRGKSEIEYLPLPSRPLEICDPSLEKRHRNSKIEMIKAGTKQAQADTVRSRPGSSVVRVSDHDLVVVSSIPG